MKSIKCEWSKGLRGEGLLTWENSYRREFHSGETTWYFHTGMIIYKRGCCTRLHVPPTNPCPTCRHHLGLTKITQGWPDPVLRQADFLPKGVIFLRVHDTAEWLCTEIKLNHAKEWNPSPVQQPGWSWATWYDSFRGMVFPGRQPVWADAGTKVNPLEPINKVLEICSLISNTLLTTLLLRILQLTVSAKDTVCSCSSLAVTIASRSISDTWLMIQFEIKLNTLITKETTGLYSTVWHYPNRYNSNNHSLSRPVFGSIQESLDYNYRERLPYERAKASWRDNASASN